MILLFILASLSFVFGALSPTPSRLQGFNLVSLMAYPLMYGALHYKSSEQTVALALIFYLLTLLAFQTYINGGLGGTVVLSYPIIPLLGSLLLGRIGAITSVILASVVILIILTLQLNWGIPMGSEIGDRQLAINRAAAIIFTLVVVAWMGWYYETLHLRAIADLAKKNQQLEQAGQFKSEFLANMSHEFRTPLNSIMGFTQRLLESKKETFSPRTSDALSTIHRNGESLLLLVNDILDISSIDAGKIHLDCAPIDLNQLCSQLSQDFSLLTQNKGLSLACELQVKPILVLADDRRLRQILTNLLSNAVKYTERGGIIVKTYIAQESAEQSLACIDLVDTGPGISPIQMAGIFEKYTRLDAHRKGRIMGTGLGLAIANELAMLHGGRISVASIVGEGSTFSVMLPIVISKTTD